MSLAACSGQAESETALIGLEEPTAIALESTAGVVSVSADDTTEVEVEETAVIELKPTAEVIVAAANDTTYVVDTAVSTIGWLGDKIVGNAHNGTIDLSEGTLVAADGALVSGSFVIDMTSIVNENLSGNDASRLIEHLMAEDFFDADSYPTATLDILSTEFLGNDQYAVTGKLTIKDTTNPIEFVAEAVEENGVVTASADVVFDRTLYDITYKSGSVFSGLGDGAINDEVQITVELVASK